MSYYSRALEIKDQIVKDRRTIHRHPELGNILPVTYEYVTSRLDAIGVEYTRCGQYGIVGMIGKGKPVVMLRADMDALPMPEESGVDFPSEVEGVMHACGHDCHVAMLIAAAQMLKENEAALKGTVKLLFQPGEETGTGAREMVENGVLENPVPDIVLAQHVDATMPLGRIMRGSGYSFASNDNFDIYVHGKAIHASRPEAGVDAVTIGAYLQLAIQSLISREASPRETNVISVTAVKTSTDAYNVLPDTLHMRGTIRCYNEEQRQMLKERLTEICENIGKTMRAEVEVQFSELSLPAVYCQPEVTEKIVRYTEEMLGEGSVYPERFIKVGSEDFVLYSSQIPSSYFFIGAGIDEKTPAPIGQHNSKVVENEEVLPLGAAFLANAAEKYLSENS